ncbi:MAG: SDR family oxidoreductase [Anaerolineae bacterium]
MPLRVLITGANRGLGLEFTRQYVQDGGRVFASCRDPARAYALQELARRFPETLLVLPLDVTNVASIDAAVSVIDAEVGVLDLLINNAGVYPHGERLERLDPHAMLRTYHVNCVGPVMMVQRALHLLRRGEGPKIVNLSSRLGSLTLKQRGGTYSYGSSKAALNMLTRTLAFDLRSEGMVVVSLHPGWVQTDMGGEEAPLTPSESVQGARQVIEGLTLEQSGGFYTWEGERLPW